MDTPGAVFLLNRQANGAVLGKHADHTTTPYDGTGPVPKAKPGDTITWRIVVRNEGETNRPDLALSELTLTDQMQNAVGTAVVYWNPAGASIEYRGEKFDLAPGDEKIFTAEYMALEADAGKDLNNTAIVKGPDDEEQDTPDTPVPVEKPGLSITKTPEHQTAKPGDTVTWTITVSNTGNVELKSVLVTDALTIGVATGFVAADGWEKAEAEGVMKTTIDTLAPGASQTFTVTYAVPEGTPEDTVITNVATAAWGALSASDQADVTTTDSDDPGPGPVDPTPGIAVDKRLSSVNGFPYGGGPVSLYDRLTYQITVTNTGTEVLNNVVLADLLPLGGMAALTLEQSWSWPSLAPGESRTVTFDAQALAAGQSLVNTATATGYPAGGGEPVSASDAEAVWAEQPYVPPVDPDPVTPPEDLNTKDHVAYIIGYPDGTVRPDGNITRAEVATIFFRLLTDEARETYWCQVNSYTDVPVQNWYNNAISTLSNMGIIDGYPDGSFRPDAPITRAELTKIAVSFFRYADQYFGYLGNFTDVTGNEWYASFVAAASALGLIEGYPDGTFRPDMAITRAETCTIVNRTLGRKPHEDFLLPKELMILWPDNLVERLWYYAQIQEATNSHDYRWTFVVEDWETSDVEQWTAKLEERDWAALEHMWSTAHSAPGGEVMG